MAKTFHVEVITPDTTVFEGDAVSLTVPAEGGSLGVLAGHAPLVSTLEVGVACVVGADGSSSYLMIGDGFLEIRDNEVKILAEVGERADAIDLARAEEAERRALDRLKNRQAKDVDFSRAKASLTRALTRIKIIRDLAPGKTRRKADAPR
ncbi:MAG: ATP synthase F1 subunit epsilon [Phycisphaeraceae bacterium]|nr:ATP synthase F1 subunit epsilon [Phycisphaeraceae bacterium]